MKEIVKRTMISFVIASLLFISAYAAEPLVHAVNVGGTGDWILDDGTKYLADFGVAGGNNVWHGIVAPNVESDEVRLFQSVREGDSFTHEFEIPNGEYILELGFIERRATDPSRVFSITVEGEVIESNFDITAEAGGVQLAVVKTYEIEITDGTFDMTLSKLNSQPASLANLKLTEIPFTGIAVNVGGQGDWIVDDGTKYLADFGVTGGNKIFHGIVAPNVDSDEVRIFQSVREGNTFTHEFEVPNGEYTLELGFFERRPTDPNRVFSISVEGEVIESNFDITAEAGGVRLAVVKRYPIVITDGYFTQTLSTLTNQPASLANIRLYKVIPTTDAPTTEPVEPTTDAPTTEPVEPTTDAPTTDAPTTDAPTTDAPTTDAPTTDAPTTDAPTTEPVEPTTDAPTTDAPTTDAPTTDAPTTDAPTTDAPTTDAPTTDAPTTDAVYTGIAVNVGGTGDWIVDDGTKYLADFGVTGGNNVWHGIVAPNVDSDRVRIFQSVREGNTFTHEFEVPNGEYILELGFIERRPTDPNRVFSITVEGKVIESNFDITAEAGGVRLAVVKRYPIVITDGYFTQTLSTLTNQPASLANIRLYLEIPTDAPTTEPVEPTTEPVEPTTEPVEPTTEPVEPTTDFIPTTVLPTSSEFPQTTEPSVALTPYAICVVTPTDGNAVRGEIVFSHGDDGYSYVEAEIYGLPPQSTHGFHIHTYGDISAPNGVAAGGHFNPYDEPHGCQKNAGLNRHVGDLGNIYSDSNGEGVYFDKLDLASLDIASPAFIIGRGFIIHAAADDCVSQPTGNAGARIGQCVIGYKNPDY